jgi:hypothetical protein
LRRPALRLDDAAMLRPLGPALATLIALAAAAQNPPRTELRQFTNLGRTFQLDLPAGWRQLAPMEAVRLSELPGCPEDLRKVQPRAFYAVGPVDRWLAGDFGGPWLYVVEQDNEWHVEGDFPAQLADNWAKLGAATGVQYDVAQVREGKVGPAGHPVRFAVRTAHKGTARATKSLDVYAPAGGQQFTLSLTCQADEFDRYAPEFDRWLQTLAFARPSRGEQKLSDRMWTPILTGGLVALVLLVLYKHTRGKR